jgi:capsular polysaccharide biosynthesis protein
MSVPQEPDSLEFAGYFGVLRRRWWIVLVWVCLGVVGAGAYIVVSPKAYTATTTVNVIPTGVTQSQVGAVAGGRTSGSVNLDTESQIVESSSVAAIAAHALHSALTPTALASNVSVAVPPNSSVLQISCEARSAQQAAACANAFAAAYLQNRSATADSATNAELGTVRNQLTALEKRTAQLTIQIRSLPVNAPRRASAEAQLQTATGQMKAMANQAASLSAQAAASSGGSIITKATQPVTPSSPKKKVILPSGLLAGLLVGLVIAFAWDKRDTRIKDTRNLGQFGVPALLTLSGKDLDGGPLASPRSTAGLEFTELARSLTATLGQDEQLVMVAGASPGHSAAVTGANLAVALARTHSAVILVCPGGQRTAELLGVPQSRCLDARGAAELAVGELSVDDVALQPARFPGLRVIVLAADLHDLPHAHAMRLAGQLRSSAEYAVIQACAPGTGPDSLALAEYCGAALLAIEISLTKRPQIEDSIRRLNRLGTSVVGVAVLPRLRLPAAGRQVPDRLSGGSVRLRKAEPAASAAGSGQTWPDPAEAKDGEAALSMPAVHADAADGPSGN